MEIGGHVLRCIFQWKTLLLPFSSRMKCIYSWQNTLLLICTALNKVPFVSSRLERICDCICIKVALLEGRHEDIKLRMCRGCVCASRSFCQPKCAKVWRRRSRILDLDQLQLQNQDTAHVRWEVLYAKWEAFTPGLENENKWTPFPHGSSPLIDPAWWWWWWKC